MTWVMAGVAVVGGGIKMYQGHQQKKAGERAEREAKLNKPEFRIPIEEQANLLDAKKRALEGLPEAQRRAAEQDIQRTSQASMRSVQTRKGGLGMISQVASQEGRSNLALMQADVSARRSNLQDLMRQRSVIAGYKNKRFEHEYNEYSADLDYARAQIGAGIQNQQSGIDTMISGIGGGIAGAQTKQMNKDNETTNQTDPQARQKPGIGGYDKNIFTGKRREAYNQFVYQQGGDPSMYQDDPFMNQNPDNEIMSFGEFKQSQFNPYGASGWDKFKGWFNRK